MIAFIIVVYLICACYVVLNMKHDLQMLQQNSYRIKRYWKYLKDNLMGPWRLVDIALLFLLFSTLLPVPVTMLLTGIVCVTKMFLISRRKSKKPLVFTKRVWRIYSVASVLAVGCIVSAALTWGTEPTVWSWYSGPQLTAGVAMVCAIISWAFVIAAVFILMPVEKAINRRYWNDASRILKSMPELKIVGITGSYGKTSTKHYLNRILEEEFDVLMTPGSFNTPMGVIRTVREMMKPYHKVFICEMGAKQVGDIKEICDLVNPQMGIVTAVGPMHLESFKTMENVQKTKFELVDSLPADGFAVINNDFEYCANRKIGNVSDARYCLEGGNEEGCEYVARNIRYTPSGTDFTLTGPDGLSLYLHTRLVGGCNISNLVGAAIIALRLGVGKERIARAVAQIEQVEHRLSIKQTPGGVVIIDDAFNSNPSGSKMALEVLSGFKNGKRIVVTPGMIELGEKQVELNKELGKEMAKTCDVAIVVGQYNRDAIVDGLKEGSFPEESLHVVASFNEAQQVLAPMLKAGDAVLYENDLPDTFK